MIGKVCAKCQVELRPKKNGVGALEMAANGAAVAIYDVDLWSCPICALDVLLGFGSKPISEHFKGGNFWSIVEGYDLVIKFWSNEAEKTEAEAENVRSDKPMAH